ncbi:hypothetical protein [Methylobacterium longum]|uniref:Uncharacterized protein n=1 Tax=Methylobacterium longum TaxID=767694 RepID=A0ABT8APU1_9HYPH|nr:hypothetical protein [Methylobacterium longum]MDN3571288.1 hypothetical protein [Methylobacterium longum]GJE09135.1 hypothetical protein FOHLNKBM_0155 [Methylobacterium longum]
MLPEACTPRLAPAADVNHHLLGRALDGRDAGRLRRDCLDRLSRTLSETRADTVILSYEDFAVQRPGLCVPSVLADIFARHDFGMDVALVVKPQAEQLTSAYALRTQLIAEPRTFEEFVRREGSSGRYDYVARLEPWRRAAEGRVVALPVRDLCSEAPLLVRLVESLGLYARLGPLLSPDDLTYRTNRSAGPVAVEASRRLHGLGLHRMTTGRHPRRLGHLLDDLAQARGLDAEPFRGNAPNALAKVEAGHGPANERLAAICWGRGWDAVVARVPMRPPNELAGRPIPPEIEAQVDRLVTEMTARVAFRTPPAWLRRLDGIVERGVERIADLAGRPAWRVR